MDTEAPGTFDDGPRRSLTRMEEEADRKHDAMSNVDGAPRIAQRLPDASDWRDGAGAGAGRHGRADHLGAGCQRRRLSEVEPGGSAAARRRTRTSWSWPAARWKSCSSLDPPGIAARDLRECLLLQLTPGHAVLRGTQDAHQQSPGGPARQSTAADRAKDRLHHRRIQKAWEQLRKLNPKPGAQFAESLRAHRDPRHDRSNRRTTAPTASSSRTRARRGCTSASTTGSG